MLDIPNVLLALTAAINAGLVAYIYTKDRKSPVNIGFALFVLFLSFWALAILQFRLTSDEHVALAFIKGSYIAAILIATCFYYFSIVYPDKLFPGRLHGALLVLVTVTTCTLIASPSFLTIGITPHDGWKGVTLVPSHFFLFAGVFALFFLGGQIRLWIKFFQAEGSLRLQLFSIALSVTTIGCIGIYFNLVLPSPYFEDFRYIWTGPLFTFFFATVITYASFRFHLFNAKLIITELLTFSLWLLLLLQFIFSDSTHALILNGTLLVGTLVLGIFLIRSVRGEVEAREKVEKLARDLEKANERLKELDRQKTEFVSIASHQLRSPLTAIKGYASLLLEGSYGKMTAGSMGAVKKIFDSSRYMAASIEDFLSVSRIELGTAKYDMKPLDAAAMAKEVLEELLPAAGDKKLTLAFRDKCAGACSIMGDIGKLRQVVLNLIDNSIKYTPQGGITVTAETDHVKRVARIIITDTGVGIPTDVMPSLFKKFSRAKNANEVNVMGTGLGLFVAKEFVEAHKGRIWAESLGQGKGSSFIIELPLSS